MAIVQPASDCLPVWTWHVLASRAAQGCHGLGHVAHQGCTPSAGVMLMSSAGVVRVLSGGVCQPGLRVGGAGVMLGLSVFGLPASSEGCPPEVLWEFCEAAVGVLWGCCGQSTFAVHG